MGLQWQHNTWQQSHINIYRCTTGVRAIVTVGQNQDRIHDAGCQKPGETAQPWIRKMVLSQPRPPGGVGGWRTMTRLFFGLMHSCAQVLLSRIAGVLFKKHFLESSISQPSGCKLYPTAGWHTAGIWKRLYTNFLSI